MLILHDRLVRYFEAEHIRSVQRFYSAWFICEFFLKQHGVFDVSADRFFIMTGSLFCERVNRLNHEVKRQEDLWPRTGDCMRLFDLICFFLPANIKVQCSNCNRRNLWWNNFDDSGSEALLSPLSLRTLLSSRSSVRQSQKHSTAMDNSYALKQRLIALIFSFWVITNVTYCECWL